MTELARFMHTSDVARQLSEYSATLDFDLSPLPLWGHSPAVLVGLDRWTPIRNGLLDATGRLCQICHLNTAITDHAVWQYEDNMPDDYTGIRTLIGFEVLCAYCMAVRHPALRRKFHVSTRELIDHYCRVNDVGRGRFFSRYADALRENARRGLVDWKEDVYLLVNMGLLDREIAARLLA